MEMYIYGRISERGMEPYPPRVRRDLDLVPRGNSRSALVPLLAPANQRSVDGGGIYTPCGAVLSRGITVFVPGLLDLCMYGSISDTGMGTYHSRVRRDLDIIPFRSVLTL